VHFNSGQFADFNRILFGDIVTIWYTLVFKYFEPWVSTIHHGKKCYASNWDHRTVQST